MTASHEIAALLERVARKDRAAFSALYQATSAKLYGIALRILRRRDLADEVLQEVYVKIWDRAGDFDASRASPVTWLATIMRNRALDEIRRQRPASIEDYPEALNIASGEESALMRVMRGEDGRRLAECLTQLEPNRRDMVVLAYCEGFSRDELAAKYGQPVNTIKTWLRRSLKLLKECLGR